MLHLANGDAAVPVIKGAALPGRIDVWREALSEGPAPPRWDDRAAWLARTGQASESHARAEWERMSTMLEAAAKEDEVVLWFDADLFCQANLAYLAEALPDGPRLTLASGTHARGAHAPAAVRALFEARAPFPREAYRAAWRAMAAPDPRGVLEVPLAFLGHHLARFPDASGLSALERRTLAAVREVGADERAVLARVAADGHGEALGLTDVMVRETLAELQRGPRPLVSDGRPTALAMQVLAGRADNVRERGVDRWVGGARLQGRGPVWRYHSGRLEHG